MADNTVQALFAEQAPDLCPTDPIEKQRFLAAHALARLLAGGGAGKAGRPEFVAVIDGDAPLATVAERISTTCCPCARNITARSTTTTGSSSSNPTGS